jgi:hypothetical protein
LLEDSGVELFVLSIPPVIAAEVIIAVEFVWVSRPDYNLDYKSACELFEGRVLVDWEELELYLI